MSVLLETSVGDLVIDLEVDKAPRTCDNFLKLCAIKYYNDCAFHTVQRNHTAQTGDPTNTGTGGQSLQALLAAAAAKHSATSASDNPPRQPASRFLRDELDPSLSHARAGTVGASNLGLPHSAASQFYITTAPNLQSLDGSHTVFGHVAEGLDVLERINKTATDERGRPTAHIRIRHVAVLDDPFPMPDEVAALIPPQSPPAVNDPFDYENIHPTTTAPTSTSPAPVPAVNPHAVVLEMIGDLPSADAAPPDNVLFVARLNPVTRSDDLQLIFSRFGRVLECSVVQDRRSGASLGYGFVEFSKAEECEAAYLRMDNALIDDRRIRVDFSQSVSRQWKQLRRNQNAPHAQQPATAAPAQPTRAGGLMAAAGTASDGSAGRKSRWGDSRAQLPAVARAEERKESAAVEDRAPATDRGDEARGEEGRKEKRHRNERRRRSRSRERSAERTRRQRSSSRSRSQSRSRSRSRSREKERQSRKEKRRHSRESDRDSHHRGKEKDRHKHSRDRDRDGERDRDRHRHRRSRSPQQSHR